MTPHWQFTYKKMNKDIEVIMFMKIILLMCFMVTHRAFKLYFTALDDPGISVIINNDQILYAFTTFLVFVLGCVIVCVVSVSNRK